MAKERKSWKCEVCGYIHSGDNPPGNCPVCGVDQELFSLFEAVPELKQEAAMPSWKCMICGYVHEEDSPPDLCPVCAAPVSAFEEQKPVTSRTVSDQPSSIVIVGGGIAAVTAAENVRRTSANASITLISKENYSPYYRLNLTRYLAGEVQDDSLPLFPPDWYSKNEIEIVYSEVKSIDREAHKVSLSSGQDLSYDKLILANGSHPFTPPLPGINLEGVHVFRTIGDAKNIIEEAKAGTRWVCIGGGLLGLETAGALKKRGIDVSLIESHGWLLPRQLPEKAGLKLLNYVQESGIEIHSSVRTKEIVGDEHVAGVLTDSGETIPADQVVFATGIRPNSYLARLCGIKVNKGVLVDDQLKTSDPSIYAAGDVAEHQGKLYGIWPASYAQGAVAGMNAAGADLEFGGLAPSNCLKVLDLDLYSIGQILPTDGSYQVLEEELGGNYRYFVCRDGVIVGGVLYGDTSLSTALKDAIEQGKQIPMLNDLNDAVPGLTSLNF